MAPVPHPPYIYTQSSLCDFTAPPIKSLDTPSLDSGLVIALLWPIEFSRSDIVPVLSLGLNRPCMFPLPLPLPFPLPPSHPPPPPRLLPSHRLRLACWMMTHTWTSLHHYPSLQPTNPLKLSHLADQVLSLDQPRPEESPSRNRPKLPTHCIKN